jgi:hypothetical protein
MSEGVRWYAGTITHRDAWGYAKWPGRITTTDQRRAGVSTGNRIHLSSQGDARRWGLAIPRRHGRHVSDAVVESLVTSVDERWEKVPGVLAWLLRRLVLAGFMSRFLYLLFTSAARFERFLPGAHRH